jgi:hypothetical protein
MGLAAVSTMNIEGTNYDNFSRFEGCFRNKNHFFYEKKSLISNGQQFHKYENTEQPLLGSKHKKTKKVALESKF